ncbi:hypothetical protein [Oceanobacillus sp. FSL H7-0719]|uniref:hypothetical protein n=1 Tax=Oceanobacillus sp. FSL H7-0719 TaxID=2954507 RepID=UPI00324605CA
MDKTKELIQTIEDNPDRELIFLYPNEGSDDYYTLGHPSRIVVDEYWIGGDRVWLKYDDEIEIFEHYADNFFDDLYPDVNYATDEQSKIIDEKTKEFLDRQNWKKCICVYIKY